MKNQGGKKGSTLPICLQGFANFVAPTADQSLIGPSSLSANIIPHATRRKAADPERDAGA